MDWFDRVTICKHFHLKKIDSFYHIFKFVFVHVEVDLELLSTPLTARFDGETKLIDIYKFHDVFSISKK